MLHVLEAREQPHVHPPEQLGERDVVVRLGRQGGQALGEIQCRPHLLLGIRADPGTLQRRDLFLQRRTPVLKLLEDCRDCLVLRRRVRQAQVAAHLRQLRFGRCQLRLPGVQLTLRPCSGQLLLRPVPKPLFDLGQQAGGEHALPQAAEQEPHRGRPVQVVVVAPLAVALLVVPADVSERAPVGRSIQGPTAVHVKGAAAERVLGRVVRPRLASLLAGAGIECSDQLLPPSRLDDRLKRGRHRGVDQRRFRVLHHLGLAVRAAVGLLQLARAVRREPQLVAHRAPPVAGQGHQQRVAGDTHHRGLMPAATDGVLDTVVGAQPAVVGRGHPLGRQRGRDPRGRHLLQQVDDASHDGQLLLRSGQPDDVVAPHPHPLAIGQLPDGRAVVLDEPAAEAVARPAPDREAQPGQLDLGVDDLLGQLAPVAAGLVVVHGSGDEVRDVAPLAPGQGRRDLVHKDQGNAVAPQHAFEDQAIDGVIRPGQAVSARNEDV